MKALIRFVILICISVILLSIAIPVQAHSHQENVLSSISEFKKCVRKQMRYKDAEIRVLWDVQTASCYAFITKGGVLIPEPAVDAFVDKLNGIHSQSEGIVM